MDILGTVSTLSPKCHVSASWPLTTTMSPSPSPPPAPAPVPLSKIARDERAANRSAGLVSAAPKSKSTSRKRQQSNADESANKRNKTETTDLDDTTMDAAIVAEEENEAKKGGKKGKKAKKTGGKGKNTYLSLFIIIFYLIISITSSRKTWAERQDEDEVENAKGIPARLKPYAFFIF